MNNFVKKYLGKKGQGLTEYALILAFIVGLANAAFTESQWGQKIRATFIEASAVFDTANPDLKNHLPAKDETK